MRNPQGLFIFDPRLDDLYIAAVAPDVFGIVGNPAAKLTTDSIFCARRNMPTDIAERIFEPFISTKMQGCGTGLGLAMVHGIIEDHGGKIEMRSEAGTGTTFTVFPPAGYIPELDNAANEFHSSTAVTAKAGYARNPVTCYL